MMTGIVKMRWLGLVFFYATVLGGTTAPIGLEERLAEIAKRADSKVSVGVMHVESGRSVSVRGEQALPLYSVVKLPLAVIVLKDVEGGKRRLDEKVMVRPNEVAAGSPGNTQRWKKAPIEVTVCDLLEFSIIDSDNTSCDKLLDLMGGPPNLTLRLRALGFKDIEVGITVKELSRDRDHLNRASANAIVQLLSALQKGQVLRSAEREVLFDMMRRARTGPNRLRGLLPAGTTVLDKTGTGGSGTAVNDVGIIALPDNRGHLAIAVFVNGSKLPTEAQERIIADAALASYQAFLER